MPHPKDRKARTRQRILESASRLFAARGFEATSIELVMLECGLTRGGFYSHFKSKVQLYEEALGGGHLAKLATAPADSSLEWLRRVFAACSGGTPASSEWAFLATDVASTEPQIRESYLRAVDTMRQKLAAHLQVGHADSSDEVPLAVAAMLIGALAISSSVDAPKLQAALVDACRTTLQRLGSDGGQTFFWTIERGQRTVRSP